MDFNFDIQDDEFDILADEPVIPVKQPEQKTADEKSSDASTPPVTPTLEETDIDILGDNVETPAEGEAADGEEDNAPVEDDIYQKIANNLLEQGIFTLNEDEEAITIKNSQEFADRWKAQNQRGAHAIVENIVGQYGPEYTDAFNKIFVQGLNPYEYFTRSQEIDNFKEMDIENEEVQKHIFRSYWKEQNISPERIEAKLQKEIDLDELKETSKELHSLMSAKAEQRLQQEAAESEKKIRLERQAQAQYANSIFEFLKEKVQAKDYDGIPVPVKTAEEVYDFMITPKYTYQGREITEMEKFFMDMQKPENRGLAVKFALLAKSGFNTTSIEKKAISKQNNKLFTDLTNKSKQEGRVNPNKGAASFFD